MSSMKDYTKGLLASRRSLELYLLREIQNWEELTGLCVSSVVLSTCALRSITTTVDGTTDVHVEVLL